MTLVLKIAADGTVSESPFTQAHEAAHAELEHTPVVTLHHPMFVSLTIGYVDDWGATNGSPLNEKAWALYGGSPIYGPMWVADDNLGDLDPEVVALLLGDTDWVGPEIRRSMDAFLRRGN